MHLYMILSILNGKVLNVIPNPCKKITVNNKNVRNLGVSICVFIKARGSEKHFTACNSNIYLAFSKPFFFECQWMVCKKAHVYFESFLVTESRCWCFLDILMVQYSFWWLLEFMHIVMQLNHTGIVQQVKWKSSFIEKMIDLFCSRIVDKNQTLTFGGM